jgi:hypothetical protein
VSAFVETNFDLVTEEPLPLEVVPNWDEQLRRAEVMVAYIGRHLDYEAKERVEGDGKILTPIGLCPEQRIALLTDVAAVVWGRRIHVE